jgi:acyl-CoA synthetase (NDP forming)/RimJ/RimL family protein N-acetyltransferase
LVMAGYPHEFEFDVLLTDGSVVHLRPIRPEDAPLEHAFILRVGPQSMYQRFFRAKNDLSPEELRYFTTIDYADRMALIALDGDRMVAVGRYDVTNPGEETSSRVAEVAFLVEDSYQGRGIGSLLLQHLTVYARLKGVTEFEAFVLADNFGMMRLFRSSGYRVERSLEEDVYTVEFPTEYSPEARTADWEHERRSVTASLVPLFFPRRVAVVGAEQTGALAGGRVLRNLVLGSYTGIVFPVNPATSFVHSIKSYPSIIDIPDDIDLAFITVPPEEAVDALAVAGAKGVRAVVVTGWTTDERRTWEERLLRAARRAGMSLFGHTGVTDVSPGRIALATQSGALAVAMLSDAALLSCGLSSFVSLGDAGDITANDLLIYWEGDPDTTVIGLYVESFGNPRRFGRLARRVGRNKPIVAVKGGRSSVEPGPDAEHRAAAVEALFRASGVIRAETMTELFDIVQLLERQPLPGGRRVVVVADTPGPASLTAGALEANGLELPATVTLGGRTLANPILTDAGGLADTLAAVATSGQADAIVIVDVPHVGPDQDLAALPEKSEVTIVAVRMGEGGHDVRLPVYRYPEPAARALAAAVRYAEWRSRPEGGFPEFADVDRAGASDVVRQALGRLGPAGGMLLPDEIGALLDRFGIDHSAPQAMGVEVAVSMTEDAVFGPLVVFRMSGATAELSGDRSFRINPLRDVDARDMIDEVKAAALLDDGETRATLADLILRVSFLVENAPEITAMTLDPIHVSAQGSVVGAATASVRPLPGAFSPSRKDVPGRML